MAVGIPGIKVKAEDMAEAESTERKEPSRKLMIPMKTWFSSQTPNQATDMSAG